jgi:hypothetical protein
MKIFRLFCTVAYAWPGTSLRKTCGKVSLLQSKNRKAKEVNQGDQPGAGFTRFR